MISVHGQIFVTIILIGLLVKEHLRLELDPPKITQQKKVIDFLSKVLFAFLSYFDASGLTLAFQ